MATAMWWAYIDRYFDLVETIVFLLRKKDNQVSLLHVYHHSFVVVAGWFIVKYSAGGMISLNFLINCVEHLILYSYYLISSFPQLALVTRLIKPWVTIFQMASIILILKV